jgi:site-specific DNA-methyltransferase (adenine-specific)
MAALAEKNDLTKTAVTQAEAGRGRLDTVLTLARSLDLTLYPDEGTPIGERLAKVRRIRGFSQRALARQSGVSAPTIAAIEAGELRVHVAKLQTLVATLGTSLTLVPNRSSKPHWASSARDDWETPIELAHLLADAVGGCFCLDAASPGPRTSRIPARQHYDRARNALLQPWQGRAVYVNPPYGTALPAFVAKAVEEVESGRAGMVVALLPSYTDTRVFHKFIQGRADYVRFLKGRLKFGDSQNSAPFGSMVVIWGGEPDLRAAVDQALNQWEETRTTGALRRKSA